MNDREMNNGNSQPWSATDVWAPGWYADPWQSGRERRWTGNAWTEETRGALGPNISGLGGPSAAAPMLPPEGPPADVAPPSPTTRWTARRLLTIVAAVALIALILGFTVTYVAADTSSKASDATTPTTNNTLPTQLPTPGTTPSFGSLPGNELTPPSFGSGSPSDGSSGTGDNGTGGSGASGGGQQSTDPNASVLQKLVVQQSDVQQPDTVQLSDGGDSVAGAPTLDLCNGTFPSESLRTARLQVNVDDETGAPVFSTEAVLYRNPSATSQAFSELQSVVAQCPSTPVQSPVGEPTATTKFTTPPDANWSQVAGVQRQAYAFTTTDDSGNTDNGAAVYLRRGRALIGLYFQNPGGAQASVAGNTTMQSIVNLFAQRLAAVPASTIGA